MSTLDLPEIPANVYAGNPVRADDMNKILEWMRAAQGALAALASETASAAGTPAPSAPWESAPRRHPFEVGVEYDAAGAPARIVVARGNVWDGGTRIEVEETALDFAPGKIYLVLGSGAPEVKRIENISFYYESTPVEIAEVRAPDASGDVVVRQFLRGDVCAGLPHPFKVSARKNSDGKWVAAVRPGTVFVAPDVMTRPALFDPGADGFVTGFIRAIPEGGTTISVAAEFTEYKTPVDVFPFTVDAYGEITVEGTTHTVHCSDDDVVANAEFTQPFVSAVKLVFSNDRLEEVFPGAARAGRIVEVARIFPVKNADGELTGYSVSQRLFGDAVVPAIRMPADAYRG